jgi:isoamylase
MPHRLFASWQHHVDFLSDEWKRAEGSPIPLGVTFVAAENAYNFALFSRAATDVMLLLYSAADIVTPLRSIVLDPGTHRTNEVWHIRLAAADVESARYYAYRVNGPRLPSQGHRFDPDKILLDPYATAVYFPPRQDRGAACRAGSDAGLVPLGLLPPADGDSRPPAPRATRHAHDLVIYELHVRGFTAHPSSGLDQAIRGTFKGVAQKIPYLKDLGITAVELMPVHQFDPQDSRDWPTLPNYWGYSTLNFFAPHNGYAVHSDASNVVTEFKDMVDALHAADIEVILDVVYNHTTEGGEGGPTYSFRGIDNRSYYVLDPGDLEKYPNASGCGNDLRTSCSAVRCLIADSLRHWATELRVDGFRFDLASIFMRNDSGNLDLESPVVSEISTDPVLAGLRLIAEPWGGDYVLGHEFAGHTWAQWNDRYRDDVRSFVKSDNGVWDAFFTRLCGSPDIFTDQPDFPYHPYQSLNFVDCHDGFCLYDLVSYNAKHNEPNGENNRDGHEPNFSWNCGWEGDDGVPNEVLALRRKQIKNFCAILLLSNGTPMFVAGDEFMRTQRGNNNAYNQDNDTSWIDWTKLRANADIFRFFKLMIAFRKAHPTIARSRFWRSDARVHGTSGPPDSSFYSHSLALFLNGSAMNDDDVYVMINAYWEPLTFTIQEGAASEWLRVIDTSRASPDDILEPHDNEKLASGTYTVQPRSLALLRRAPHANR